LARRIIFHWLVFVAVSWGVAMFLQLLSDPFRPVVENVRIMWATQGPLMLVMVFLLPVFVMDTVKLSHRFAGPIISLRRAMREIAEGKPARKVQFRKQDFWLDLADDYNAVAARLNGESESHSSKSERETVGSSTN
jgi:nitrogen fixation/metabolism regulation signal transduction histidine kinase